MQLPVGVEYRHAGTVEVGQDIHRKVDGRPTAPDQQQRGGGHYKEAVLERKFYECV